LISIELVFGVIGAVVAGIAAFYYILTVRNTLRNMQTTLETRQAQLFMQIYNNFHETEFFDKFTDIITWKWRDYDDFLKKYGWKENPKAFHSMGSVAAYFEGIGVLVHRNFIDVDLVGELMSRHVVLFWEKIEPISKEMRKRYKLPVDLYLEHLYNEIKPFMEKQLLELSE